MNKLDKGLKRYSAVLLSGTLLTGLFSATAGTETAAVTDASENSAVIVTGKRLTTGVLPERPPKSIYGLEASALDTPRAVSEVSAEQLLRDPIRTTDDYVKYAPGITRGGGQGTSAAPTLRGLSAEVFQNGQRIYKDGNDHPLNLNAFEGADIVAGPSSVIFGPSNATGGYVNYLTKKPYFDKQRSFVTTELGTWVPSTHETYPDFAITADTGGPIDETLAYRISVKGKRGGTYYDNVENNYDSTYGAISWKPTERLTADWNGSGLSGISCSAGP
ncbi:MULTISPECIES: TonB-dependent receptor plug domain-containing protein [unclassified Azospirillum]|uniref:TonB-dependent receptor plug domain-containing protein n=1 Tax=unclassified Azospirillum TaxID=2630922 RepID=UPI000B747C42|nr:MULTISPECIES: TonB-dependent receptor plug domain-containing protein [unclassified Azospirillum]SNT22793.1 TonB-dependent Receptor Plug Domain [Azospirillum sp. RU38E]SNT34034.1 TonB-dependent Receptor Plug Domain [Azospirillum sp. RU37A]